MIPTHPVRPQPVPAPRAARWLAVLLGLVAASLQAQQPTGGTVVAGSATIANSANSTVVTAGDNSVLRWNSFDVGTGETVQFVQPGASSRVLNWIGGATPSQINGSLLANGQVYLMNPSGVYFGQTAVINVGALYAVGGTMTKDDFLSGMNRFSGLTGDVVNAGSIRGGMVALVGRSVANSGSIVSPGGFIGLASGEQVLLGQNGSSIYVDAGRSGPAAEGAGVANTGTIDSGAGSTVLAAGDLYSIAITQDGRLAGRDVRVQGQGRGDVLVSGTIDATGETGGRVEITGERVGLSGRANIDASGSAGGGTILVGGDFQGKNEAVRNAQTTVIAAGATLTADATAQGDGGKVIVWADNITRFAGSISARGGALGGNGGLAEVSGKGFLDFRGVVDLRAAAGAKGSLLLDPANITIQAASPDIDGVLSGATNDLVAATDLDNAATDFATASSIITDGAVETLLATTDLTLAATNDITVSSAIGWNSAFGLTLDAGNAIAVNAAITNAGSGGVTLLAGAGGISLGANLGSAGAITLTHAGALTQSTGTVTAATLNLNGAGNVATGGTPLATDLGTLVLNKAGGNTFISDIGVLSLQGTTAGNLTLTANGAITDSGALTITGTTTLAAGSANNITLDNANDFTGAVSIVSGNNVAVTDSTALVLGTSTVSGTLDLTAGGHITQTGAITATAAATTVAVTAAGSDILLGTQTNNLGTTAPVFGGTLANIRDISLQNTNAGAVLPTFTGLTNLRSVALTFNNAAIALPALTLGTGGNLSVTAGGAITQTGALVVPGTTSFTTGSFAITLTEATNDFTGAVSLANTGTNDVAVTDTNALVVGTSSIGQNLTLVAGGHITQTGAITATAGVTTATVTVAGSDILLGTQANDFDANALAFGGTLTNIRDVSFRNTDSGATLPTFTGLTNLRSLTLVLNGAPVALPALTLATGGNLSVTAGGAITQTGTLVVPGTASFSTGGFGITLTEVTNTLTGAVSLTNTGTNNVSVFNATNLVLSGVSMGDGALAATALNGSISQTGAITKTGGTSTLTIDTGTNRDILLHTSANNFGGGAVTFTTANAGTIQDIGLRDDHALASLAGLPTSARNIDLHFGGAGIVLPALTATGHLNVTANGAITDGGNLLVTGTTALAAGASNNITLDAANNFGGAVTITSGNNVTLVDTGAIDLAVSTVSGTLSVTAGGDITQSGALTVVGSTTVAVTAVDSAVLLGTQANNLGTAAPVFGGTVTNIRDFGLRNTNASAVLPDFTGTTLRHLAITFDNAAVSLPSLTLTGTLAISAGGAITDTGALAITGTTTLAAGTGNDITLDNANDFGGAVTITSGKDVTLVDTGAITLAASTVSGDLDVGAGGLISQIGALAVTGTTTLAAGANNITLDAANNFGGAVTITSGNNVTLVDSGAIDFAASTVTGNLDVDAAGAITQTGALAVTGTSNFTTGNAAITLDNASNDFTGAVSLNNAGAFNVAIKDANALTIDTSLVGSGTLTIDATAVTLSGAITSGNTVTFNNTGAISGSGLVTATTQVNFAGSGDAGSSGSRINTATPSIDVTTAGGADTFVSNQRDGGVTLTGNTTADNSTVAVTSRNTANNARDAVTVGSGNLVNSGTGSSVALIGSSLTLTGGITSPSITLDFAGDLTGSGTLAAAVALQLEGTGNVGTSGSLISINTPSLVLNKASGDVFVNNGAATSTLTATAFNGAGTFTANALTLLTAVNSGSNDVTFNTSTFALGTNAVTGGTVTINNSGGLTGTGLVTATTLNLNGAGAVGVDAANRISTDAGTIAFNKTAGNSFLADAGAVAVTGSTGGLVNLTAGGTVSLSSFTATGGFTAPGAAIELAGGTITGAMTFDSGMTITADTTFVDTVTLGGTFTAGAFDLTFDGLTLSSAATITSGAGTLTLGGDIDGGGFGLTLSLGAGGGSLTSGNTTNLDFLTVNGTGILSLGRDLTATGNSMTFNTPVTLVADTVLTDAGAVTFNDTVDGGFALTVNTSDETVFAAAVGGTTALTSLTTDAGGTTRLNANVTTTGVQSYGDAVLVESGLTLATTDSTVSFAGAVNSQAGETNNLTINTGTATVTFGGAVGGTDALDTLSITNTSATGLVIPNLTATTLNVTTNGPVTDSGVLAVTGTTTLAAGSSNNITLDNANNFSTVVITSGNNVTLNDTNALDLGASTISGALNVTTAGAITDSGVLAVTGTTTLAAGSSNNITLDNANNFSTVVISSGNNVTLNDTNALDLGASTISGALNVTTAGAVTDSGALAVTGTTTLAAGSGNDITLNTAGNDFTGAVSVVSANNVALVDANALDLGASTISGALNVTTAGAVTDSGALAVTGTTTLAAGSGNNITLDNANNFSTVVITSGNNVTLNDTNALDLGASTISGALNVTTAGAITDSGALAVTGTTTLAAGSSNNITLDNANNFSTVVISSGNNVTLNDTNALDLGASTISGALNVTTAGAITDSGVLAVTGTTTLAAGSGNNITLDNANNFSTVVISSGNNVTLNDTNALSTWAPRRSPALLM